MCTKTAWGWRRCIGRSRVAVTGHAGACARELRELREFPSAVYIDVDMRVRVVGYTDIYVHFCTRICAYAFAIAAVGEATQRTRGLKVCARRAPCTAHRAACTMCDSSASCPECGAGSRQWVFVDAHQWTCTQCGLVLSERATDELERDFRSFNEDDDPDARCCNGGSGDDVVDGTGTRGFPKNQATRASTMDLALQRALEGARTLLVCVDATEATKDALGEITRRLCRAVRRITNPHDQGAVVRFLQTDAAIVAVAHRAILAVAIGTTERCQTTMKNLVDAVARMRSTLRARVRFGAVRAAQERLKRLDPGIFDPPAPPTLRMTTHERDHDRSHDRSHSHSLFVCVGTEEPSIVHANRTPTTLAQSASALAVNLVVQRLCDRVPTSLELLWFRHSCAALEGFMRTTTPSGMAMALAFALHACRAVPALTDPWTLEHIASAFGVGSRAVLDGDGTEILKRVGGADALRGLLVSRVACTRTLHARSRVAEKA